MNPGELVRSVRKRHGLTQAQLAYRASTSQQALSAIERGEVSPSVATLERLLVATGEELQLGAQPRGHPYDPDDLTLNAHRPLATNMELAMSANGFAAAISGRALEALERS